VPRNISTLVWGLGSDEFHWDVNSFITPCFFRRLPGQISQTPLAWQISSATPCVPKFLKIKRTYSFASASLLDGTLFFRQGCGVYMRIRLLGTAAGGGVPQWNCNCLVCNEARSGSGRVRHRTQSSVAISADERNWFLLNASPDLRVQIEAFPPLHPPADRARGSPIQAVLLTNADLDHTLGVFLLREGEAFPVHATGAVRESLQQGSGLAQTMSAFCGLTWVKPPLEFSPLSNRDTSDSGLLYRAIPLGGGPPRYAATTSTASNHVVGYHFLDKKTGGRLLCLPDVPSINEEIKTLLSDCEVLLFDGTFWCENEMQQRGAGETPASQMGHMPISGPNGSLVLLKALNVKHKIYLHINNTNLILLENSKERATVLAAGCVVGEDGMELTL